VVDDWCSGDDIIVGDAMGGVIYTVSSLERPTTRRPKGSPGVEANDPTGKTRETNEQSTFGKLRGHRERANVLQFMCRIEWWETTNKGGSPIPDAQWQRGSEKQN